MWKNDKSNNRRNKGEMGKMSEDGRIDWNMNNETINWSRSKHKKDKHLCYECKTNLNYEHVFEYAFHDHLFNLKKQGIDIINDVDIQSVKNDFRETFDNWWQSDVIKFYCCKCYENSSEGKEKEEQRWLERRKQIETENQEYCSMLKQNLNLEDVEIIAGGIDMDNNLEAFNDYYATLNNMRIKLEQKGCKSPFTIISDHSTKLYASMEYHMCQIAMEYDSNIELDSMYDLAKNEGSIVKIAVNEREYIESRKRIKEWMIDDSIMKGENDYRLMLTDGKFGIVTGWLTLT